MAPPRWRGRAVLGAACAVLTGCGLIGPDIPEGYTTTELEEVQVSYPDDWSVAEAEAEEGEDEGQANYTRVSYEDDGTELARIEIFYEITVAAAITHGVGVATQGRHGVLPEYEHEVAEIDGTGAQDARRVDFTYTDVDGELTGESGPIGGVDLVLLGSDNRVHQVLVSWVDGELDSETVDEIVGTVHLDD